MTTPPPDLCQVPIYEESQVGMVTRRKITGYRVQYRIEEKDDEGIKTERWIDLPIRT